MKVLKRSEKEDLIRAAFEERGLNQCLEDGDCFWFGETKHRWIGGVECLVHTFYRVFDYLTSKNDLSKYVEVRDIGFYKVASWFEIDFVE